MREFRPLQREGTWSGGRDCEGVSEKKKNNVGGGKKRRRPSATAIFPKKILN